LKSRNPARITHNQAQEPKEARRTQYGDEASCRGLFQGTRGGTFYCRCRKVATYLKSQSGEVRRQYAKCSGEKGALSKSSKLKGLPVVFVESLNL